MTERAATVVVTSDESLAGVIERVRDAARGGRAVHLVVPIDSPLLLTASEFRSLKEALDEQRLALVLRTSDPLRLRLGERLGIRTRAVPRQKPAMAAASAVPAAASSPGIPSPPTDAPDANGNSNGADGMPIPVADPHTLWPEQNGSHEAPEVSDEPEAETTERSANSPRRWLPVVAMLVLIVLAAALALRYVVPRAVVRIVPRVEPVTASMVFDVAANGQPLDDEAAFALEPGNREVEVVWEGSVPVTGLRTEPNGTASGPIELRNASNEPLTIEAGTIVATEEGQEFTFVEAVTVPAMDAATGEPGAATGAVRAEDPGSGGNIETGELGGRLPNGVYYSNRMEPTAGGTDKEFPVVAQEDLDALSATARDEADELAADVIDQGDEPSDIVVSALTVNSQQDTFDHDVGDDAETVSLRSELVVDATYFDQAAAAQKYKPALTKQLAASAPDGFWVDPEHITFSEPVEIDEQDGVTRLEVTAHVDAQAKLSDAERQALAGELAGTNAEEAAAILEGREDVASFTIEFEPAWLPEAMPNAAGRIGFEVVE